MSQKATLSRSDQKRQLRDTLRGLSLFLASALTSYYALGSLTTASAFGADCRVVGPSGEFNVLNALFVAGAVTLLWVVLEPRDELLEQRLSEHYGFSVRRLAWLAAVLMTVGAVCLSSVGLGAFAKFCSDAIELRRSTDLTASTRRYQDVARVLLQHHKSRGKLAPYQIVVCFRDGSRWRSMWDGLHDPDPEWPGLASFIAHKAGVRVAQVSDAKC